MTVLCKNAKCTFKYTYPKFSKHTYQFLKLSTFFFLFGTVKGRRVILSSKLSVAACGSFLALPAHCVITFERQQGSTADTVTIGSQLFKVGFILIVYSIGQKQT